MMSGTGVGMLYGESGAGAGVPNGLASRGTVGGSMSMLVSVLCTLEYL